MPKPVKYVRSVVSYVDILGFRELIETRTAGDISRILRILAESVAPSKSDTELFFGNKKPPFTKFSDTVIRSVPIPETRKVEFLFELEHLTAAQVALLSEDIVIRGAVTIGDIVQSWGIVYGPAVVKAYELENRKGSPPRIIIDPAALGEVKNDPLMGQGRKDEIEGLLRGDPPLYFLDYLGNAERTFNVPEQEYPEFLRKHKNLILNRLAKHAGSPEILRKYEWLKHYHNDIIASLIEHDFSPKLLIDD